MYKNVYVPMIDAAAEVADQRNIMYQISTYIFLLKYFYRKCICINSTQMPVMNSSIIGKH